MKKHKRRKRGAGNMDIEAALVRADRALTVQVPTPTAGGKHTQDHGMTWAAVSLLTTGAPAGRPIDPELLDAAEEYLRDLFGVPASGL